MLYVGREEYESLVNALATASLRCRDVQGLMVHTDVSFETARRVALGAVVAAVGHPIAVEGSVFMPPMPNWGKVDAKPD